MATMQEPSTKLREINNILIIVGDCDSTEAITEASNTLHQGRNVIVGSRKEPSRLKALREKISESWPEGGPEMIWAIMDPYDDEAVEELYARVVDMNGFDCDQLNEGAVRATRTCYIDI